MKNTVRYSFVFPCEENRLEEKEKRPVNTSGVEANKAESHRAAGCLPVRLESTSAGSPAVGSGQDCGTGLWPGPRSSSELCAGRTERSVGLTLALCCLLRRVVSLSGGGATMLQSAADSSSEYTRFRYDWES